LKARRHFKKERRRFIACPLLPDGQTLANRGDKKLEPLLIANPVEVIFAAFPHADAARFRSDAFHQCHAAVFG
jgi:hypothetical protein